MMKFVLNEKGQGKVAFVIILLLVVALVCAVTVIAGPLVGKVYSTIPLSL